MKVGGGGFLHGGVSLLEAGFFRFGLGGEVFPEGLLVLECAVEPSAGLPDNLEHREGGAVVASECVVGGISRAADFAEELVDLVREDAVVA